MNLFHCQRNTLCWAFERLGLQKKLRLLKSCIESVRVVQVALLVSLPHNISLLDRATNRFAAGRAANFSSPTPNESTAGLVSFWHSPQHGVHTNPITPRSTWIFSKRIPLKAIRSLPLIEVCSRNTPLSSNFWRNQNTINATLEYGETKMREPHTIATKGTEVKSELARQLNLFSSYHNNKMLLLNKLRNHCP